MKLKKVQVSHFRHVLDSTPVEIQSDVTCLIGKNESGKTTFLEALWRLNPANGNPDLDITKHYPAWLEKRHRKEGRDIEQTKFVRATFEIEQADRDFIAERFGEEVLTAVEIEVSRSYAETDGTRTYNGVTIDEEKAIATLVRKLDLPNSIQARAVECRSLKSLAALADSLQADEPELSRQISAAISERYKDSTVFQAVVNSLHKRLPRFFYFRDYSRLPGIVKIRELLEADKDTLDIDSQTARSLLEMAGADSDYLLNPDYQQRKRELENVANELTQDVLEYWTTNNQLRY